MTATLAMLKRNKKYEMFALNGDNSTFSVIYTGTKNYEGSKFAGFLGERLNEPFFIRVPTDNFITDGECISLIDASRLDYRVENKLGSLRTRLLNKLAEANI